MPVATASAKACCFTVKPCSFFPLPLASGTALSSWITLLVLFGLSEFDTPNILLRSVAGAEFCKLLFDLQALSYQATLQRICAQIFPRIFIRYKDAHQMKHWKEPSYETLGSPACFPSDYCCPCCLAGNSCGWLAVLSCRQRNPCNLQLKEPTYEKPSKLSR